MQYRILFTRETYGEWSIGTARSPATKQENELGFSTEAFDSNRVPTARRLVGGVEAHLGSIILALNFPTELQAQVNHQPGGSRDCFNRILLIDHPGMTASSALDKLSHIARLFMGAYKPSHHVEMQSRCAWTNSGMIKSVSHAGR